MVATILVRRMAPGTLLEDAVLLDRLAVGAQAAARAEVADHVPVDAPTR